jgi:hypothetical protein
VDAGEMRGDENDDGGGREKREGGRLVMMKGERRGRKGSPERLFARFAQFACWALVCFQVRSRETIWARLLQGT